MLPSPSRSGPDENGVMAGGDHEVLDRAVQLRGGERLGARGARAATTLGLVVSPLASAEVVEIHAVLAVEGEVAIEV